MSAIEDVLAERRRQIHTEGWTEAHDDQHCNGELARAAACYCAIAGNDDETRNIRLGLDGDLVRAGALIIAEIERLDRASERSA